MFHLLGFKLQENVNYDFPKLAYGRLKKSMHETKQCTHLSYRQAMRQDLPCLGKHLPPILLISPIQTRCCGRRHLKIRVICVEFVTSCTLSPRLIASSPQTDGTAQSTSSAPHRPSLVYSTTAAWQYKYSGPHKAPLKLLSLHDLSDFDRQSRYDGLSVVYTTTVT